MMKASLFALVAVLALGMFARQAHAFCPTGSQLELNSRTWAIQQIGYGMGCFTLPQGPVGSNCAPDGGHKDQCHRASPPQPDYWQFDLGVNCSNANRWMQSDIYTHDTSTWNYLTTFHCGCQSGETNWHCQWG